MEDLSNAGEDQLNEALADALADDSADELEGTPNESEIETQEGQEDGEGELETEIDDLAGGDDADPELIEWGEGDDVKSVSLDELIAAYENPQVDFDQAPQVQARVQELEQVKTAQIQAARDTLQERESVAQAIKAVYALTPMPKKPDYDLVQTDPNEYNRQLAEFNKATDQQQQLVQAYQANEVEVERRQAQVEAADVQAVMQEVRVEWPSFEADKSKAEKILADTYGFKPEHLQGVIPTPFYRMVKAHIELLDSKAAGAKATKTLTAKAAPRRVKSRKGTTSGQDLLTSKIKAGKATEEEMVGALASLM